jgi:CRISPR-associated exonuclease Cas4
MTPLPILTADSEEYPPLSALNDYLFCSRRCFLHRVEGVWVENAHTLTGSHDHRRVHATRDSDTSSGRTARGLRLISHTLKVQGVADLVEFPEGIPYPVEYKRGKRRKWDNDEVQLCAQAICLEEMLGVSISAGAIFHIKSKRRREVPLTPKLREQTRQAAGNLHELLKRSAAPAPVLHPKCKQCSLHAICLPELLSAPKAYRKAAGDLFSKPAS